jgi:cytochrome c peroxidase
MARLSRNVLLFILSLASGVDARADEALRREAAGLFGGGLRAAAVHDPARVDLGRRLFWDERVSSDGKTSCASCHPASDWGADRRAVSVDARGKPTQRNSQTIFNAMAQASLRWLGDRKDGPEQAERSLTGSLGFATGEAGLARLAELGYGAAFRAAFPGEAEALTLRNYGRALADYQASLVTPSRFDRWLAGEDRALAERELRGLRQFVAVGCAACHRGPLAGGTMMQRFGIARDYWLETGSRTPDAGRYAVTKKEEDRYVFRVPMLRNVARTAPYFHDGSVASLGEAVNVMARVQLGRRLDEDTTASIVAFLESLTGEVPAHYAPPR